MTPSINRMIKLLEEDERKHMTKEHVIKCETEIIKKFDFDFNTISPLTFLERFIRISEMHNEFFVDSVSVEVLKMAAS